MDRTHSTPDVVVECKRVVGLLEQTWPRLGIADHRGAPKDSAACHGHQRVLAVGVRCSYKSPFRCFQDRSVKVSHEQAISAHSPERR